MIFEHKHPKYYREKVMDLKPHFYTPEEIITWLDECDKQVLSEIIAGHELSEEEAERYNNFKGHTYETESTSEMLVPEPYDIMYQYFLYMNIDSNNLEYDKYNNDVLMFMQIRDAYAKHFNRTHMPVSEQTHWSINGSRKDHIPEDLKPL